MSYSPRNLENIQDGILYGDNLERVAIAEGVVAELRELRALKQSVDLARLPGTCARCGGPWETVAGDGPTMFSHTCAAS